MGRGSWHGRRGVPNTTKKAPVRGPISLVMHVVMMMMMMVVHHAGAGGGDDRQSEEGGENVGE
jgi:hypothetical protein